MPPKAGWSTPMLHAMDLEKAIRFYELLGFELIDDDGCKPLSWARIHCEGGAIMFLRAEHPADPQVQGLIMVMYTPDLKGLREHLLANGVKAGEICYPEYMPSGQIFFADPDGYMISINQWGKAEHEKWEKHLAEKL